MRDQYAGDVSDVLKFAFLRALVGTDRRLGIAWYYAPGDDGKKDGRHLEWLDEPAWKTFDSVLHGGLSALPQRSVAALEIAPIWPAGVLFHREAVPSRMERPSWSARKRTALENADVVFLDPDNGMGSETQKHATYAELRALRKPGRALIFITFPGRNMRHSELVRHLHQRVKAEADAESLLTLRTNVSVPAVTGSTTLVQRQRWFTVVDPDESLKDRARIFAEALSLIPRVTARLDGC